jgi:hypothetical protein
MDLISKLNSLLSPGPDPANRATRPATAAAAKKRSAATPTFAQTLAGLADPTILPFGAQAGSGGKAGLLGGPHVGPGARPAVIAGPAGGGPTILPDMPAGDPPVPGIKDTLDEILAGGKPAAPTAPAGSEPGTSAPGGGQPLSSATIWSEATP